MSVGGWKGWLVLWSFGGMSFTNAWMWAAFITIRDVTQDALHVSPSAVDLLATSYMLIFIPLMFLAPALLTKIHLRSLVTLASVLNALGSVVRWLGALQSSYPIVLTGQCIAGFAQSLFLNLACLVSAMWFPPRQRGFSTGFLVLANQFGVAIAQVLGPIAVPNSTQFTSYMLYQAVVSSSLFVVIVSSFPSDPINQKSSNPLNGLWRQIVSCFKCPSYTVVWSVCILNMGILFALTTLIQPLMFAFHSSEKTVGWTAFVITMAGLPGTLFLTHIAVHSGHYKFSYAVCQLLSATFLVAFFVTLGLSSRPVLSMIPAALFGFFSAGSMSLGYEYGVEVSWPVSEDVSVSLMTGCSQLTMYLFISLFSLLDYQTNLIIYIYSAILVLCFVLSVLNPNKRTRPQSTYEVLLEKDELDSKQV